jgi:predicted tellurium resistance membrane protein TerC
MNRLIGRGEVRPSQWPLWRKALALVLFVGTMLLVNAAATWIFRDVMPETWLPWAFGVMVAVIIALWLWGKAIERRRQ